MKILNLYAGLGGNRKLWEGAVTSVENNPVLVEFLSKHFKEDIIICADAQRT